MKNLKILLVGLLIFSFVPAKANERKNNELRKKRVALLTHHLHDASQDCVIMSYLENNLEKLSPEEMDRYNHFAKTYNVSMLLNIYPMTVSEYLQVLSSKNDNGITIQEAADNNTQTRWFHSGDGDACYKLARGMERHEQILWELQSQGKGNAIIGKMSPEVLAKLRG